MGGDSKSSTDYEFLTVWRVAGTPREVVDVLGDAGTLPRWWPSVYLAVEPREPGNPDGTGKSFFLHTKGWLPYTLKWQLTRRRAGADPARIPPPTGPTFAGHRRRPGKAASRVRVTGW